MVGRGKTMVKKGRVTIRSVGNLNWYDICVGGTPIRKAQGKINAERQANIVRKEQGKSVKD